MKKTVIFLLFVFCTISAISQTKDGNYHILHPEKNRNTGKILETMYVQIKEHNQMGTVAILSEAKGGYGIPFKLNKVFTDKCKKLVFSYANSFFIEYDENSFVSFSALGATADGKLKINRLNYYTKDKENLKTVDDKEIERYAQEINVLTK